MLWSWFKENPFLLPVFLLAPACLLLLSHYNFLLFYNIAEIFSIAVAFGIFMVTWNARWRTGDHFLLIMGIGFACFAALDLLHTLSFEGMGVFPGQEAGLSSQLRIAARLLQAATLMAAPFFLSKRIKPWILLFNFCAATALIIVLIFLGLFPGANTAGPTATQRGTLYLVMALFLAAAVLLQVRGKDIDPSVRVLIQTSTLLAALQVAVLGIRPDSMGLHVVASHFLKILSFFFMYKAVLETGVREPQRVLFMELERGRRLLSEAEKRFRSISDGAPVGIFRSTPQGRYEYVNPKLAEIYGYDSPADLMNTVDDIARQLHVDQARYATMRKRIEKETIISGFQALMRRKDGSTVWTSRDIRAHQDIHGNLVRFDGFVTDISDRKRLENLREDVERILRHDLKAPLISITSGLALVRATCNPPPRTEGMIREMEYSALQMLSFIDLSMDLCKMESGDYEIEADDLDLITVLGQVLGEQRPLTTGKNAKVCMSLDGTAIRQGHACPVRAEEPLLRSLASNLLRNAIEAAPEHTSIQVALASGPRSSMTITNPGEVPEEIRDRFFEKYATHGKKHGTGLGTYSARLIAETHGWHVDMQTGNGITTVRVDFLGK